jgi:hypothetical protein
MMNFDHLNYMTLVLLTHNQGRALSLSFSDLHESNKFTVRSIKK